MRRTDWRLPYKWHAGDIGVYNKGQQNNLTKNLLSIDIVI